MAKARARPADLEDTSRCPLGMRCESCGLEAGDALAIYLCECALGVMCLTTCPRCRHSNGDVNIAVSTATRLVMQHAAHLGITVKDMQLLQTAGGRMPWNQPAYRWIQP